MKASNRPASATEQGLLRKIRLLLAKGQKQRALEAAKNAVTLFRASHELCNLAGVCAAAAEEPENAKQYWLRAVELNPNGAEAYSHLGQLFERFNLLNEAEKYYRKEIAIDPDPVALSNLGILLIKNKRYDEAEECYRQALAINPGSAIAHSNLGVLLADHKRDDEAEQCYRKAISLDPGNPKVFSNLGVLLARNKRLQEAENCYRRAIALDSGFAEAHTNLGLLLEALRRQDEAEQCHRTALALDQGKPEIHTNLANLLAKRWCEAEAEQHYCRAIDLDPGLAIAHSNLGVFFMNMWREVEAERCLRRALALNPGYVQAQFNLSCFLLKQGRFREGWQWHESRHDLSNQTTFPSPANVPVWSGEPLAGKAVLVWPEQGFGDEIQFCRYLTVLKAQGAARITLACKRPLVTLFQSLADADAVISVEAAEGMAAHDYWTYMLSIPRYCPIEGTGIPTHLPYLHALPEQRQRWAGLLPRGEFRVGLVWRGNKNHHNDSNRSLPGLATLAPLWSVPGVRFISLQRGEGEYDAMHSPAGQPLTHVGSNLADFADTAAVIEQLDLVISVDTAVAHLAGALGKPCWVLLPAYDTDWRWMHERSDTPWYPGVMRLFRQARGSDWKAVILDVAAALSGFL